MEKRRKPENLSKGLFKKSLKNQVENYANLGLYKSARGIAAILMILSVVAILIGMMVGLFHFNSLVLVDFAFLLILAFFVYKGKKLAMIIAMIYWTIAKGFQIYYGFPYFEYFSINEIRIVALIGWIIFILIIGYSYRVEKTRNLETRSPN